MIKLKGIAAALVLVPLACAPFFIQFPGRGELSNALNNSAHVGLFLLLSFSLAALLRAPQFHAAKPQSQSKHSWHFKRADWTLIFLLLTLGGLIEIVQWFIGRTPSIIDFALDASGSIAGIWLWKFWQSRQLGLLLMAAASCTPALIEPALVISYHARQQRALPVICDFDTHCPRHHAASSANVFIANSTLWQSNKSLVGVLEFQPEGQFPGFGLGGLSTDWSDYTQLCVDIYWPELSGSQVAFHIHDSEFLKSHNLFDRAYPVAPGVNKVCISLSEVAEKINLKDGKELIIYKRRPQRSGVLYFDNVQLQ